MLEAIAPREAEATTASPEQVFAAKQKLREAMALLPSRTATTDGVKRAAALAHEIAAMLDDEVKARALDTARKKAGYDPEAVLHDALGRPRSPATMPGYMAGRVPPNKGRWFRRPTCEYGAMTLCEHCDEPFTPSRPDRAATQRFCSRSCGVSAAYGVRHVTNTPWQERFWRFVEKGDPDACWEWQGQRVPGGYGRLMVSKTPYRTVQAHRASWEIHHGQAPDADLKVCHRCDNPACVNPAHLFLGTQGDNIADMDTKGRARRTGRPTHGDDVVAEVRRLLAEGWTQTPIARELGVSVSFVKHVRAGRTRRHV